MGSINFVDVSKHYGPVVAVDEVTLDVAQGEFVTILGPSGSGKTTVLSIIAGLNHPTAGEIWIGGRNVTALPAAKRNLGLVFQSYALFPHMSVFDNVAFPLTVRSVPGGEIVRRVARALAQVQLEGYERRKPAHLSGGQQQRVALARAIVFEPDILLLDEPLGALDRKLREEVQIELRQLQRALGITTILVTHDQEEALSLSDRIVVLDEGRVKQIATPREAYLMPASRFVADFLGTANVFEGTLEADGAGHAVVLANGVRIACGDPGRAPGARVEAIVRPERLTVGPPGEGRMDASVEEVVYLGQSVRTHLATRAGTMVAIGIDQKVGVRVGEDVGLAWSPHDVWVLPETADGGTTPTRKQE
ncbi:ABC transporter ATP-binding protein [Acuticoccus sp.]|uniref:ABC transporter ATP-binding protein n=1 Tax=Acuticoccus sp. TaxID=1904378 RepID=UPI003B52E420